MILKRLKKSFFFLINIIYSVDKETGHYFTVDPTYNPDTFATTKPEFKKSKKSKESTEEEGDGDAFVSKIQHVNLYKYRDFDKDFYRQTIADTLALCEEEVIVPYVSQKFQLSKVNEAVEFIRGKRCTGKVVIDVGQADEEDGKNDDDSDDEKEGSKKKK